MTRVDITDILERGAAGDDREQLRSDIRRLMDYLMYVYTNEQEHFPEGWKAEIKFRDEQEECLREFVSFERREGRRYCLIADGRVVNIDDLEATDKLRALLKFLLRKESVYQEWADKPL